MIKEHEQDVQNKVEPGENPDADNVEASQPPATALGQAESNENEDSNRQLIAEEKLPSD